MISSVTLTEMAIGKRKREKTESRLSLAVLKCVKLQRQTSKQKAGMEWGLDKGQLKRENESTVNESDNNIENDKKA